jgi:hypothetical protein
MGAAPCAPTVRFNVTDVSTQLCLPISLIFVGFIALLAWVIIVQIRHQQAIQKRLDEIRPEIEPVEIINDWQLRYTIQKINLAPRGAGKGIVAVTYRAIIVYDRTKAVKEQFRWPIENLRWFGRPQKYHDGINEIWLHFEQDDGWYLLALNMNRGQMQTFVRAMKQATTPELITAYRRRRPYTHVGPVTAHNATQDIYGAWTLTDAVSLYLMPRYLALFDDAHLLRKIPLENIQQIGALRRLDAPGVQGLVRFRAEEEAFSFALNDHESFAASLAEAAKRTLEAPIERKQKGKDEEEDE